MKALLIAAHGSRKQSSNDEVHQLTRKIRAISGTDFDLVACAFMQFASPSMGEAIHDLASGGASHITVFPHFIAAGSHVINDIPDAVNKASVTYPDITFERMPHLGKLNGIDRIIITNAGQTTK